VLEVAHLDRCIVHATGSLVGMDDYYLLVLSREWMGMGVAGMIIDSYCGSFPHSLLSTSKIICLCTM
jgi:hypothetical protein